MKMRKKRGVFIAIPEFFLQVFDGGMFYLRGPGIPLIIGNREQVVLGSVGIPERNGI